MTLGTLPSLTSSKFPLKRPLKDRLPQAAGALEVGGDHGFQFLHHAQPSPTTVSIRQAVIAQDAAVVPALGDEGGEVCHESRLVHSFSFVCQ
jgi:hypothetical protein